MLMITATETAYAQQNFGSHCTGNWKGTMYMYSKGILSDSVPVTLNVTPQNDSVFQWKMDYLSAKMPVTKDYHLIYKGGNHYQFDEGDGVKIDTYLFVNRLISVFETEGILLTSLYEWNKDELYFEVSSGNKSRSNTEVQSYQIGFLQNIRFKRN